MSFEESFSDFKETITDHKIIFSLSIFGLIGISMLAVIFMAQGFGPAISEPSPENCRSSLTAERQILESSNQTKIEIPNTCFNDAGEPLISEFEGTEPGDEIRITEDG